MRLKVLLKGVYAVRVCADTAMEISRLTCNSAEVTPGCMFIAVRGSCVDGNNYISVAVEKGAQVILTERVPSVPVPYVLVKDVRKAMAQISANFHHHPANDLYMIGITGTNGKTSTSLILKHILEKATTAPVGLIGTVCNMIADKAFPASHTTPDSIQLQALLARMRDAGCRYVVMEVSSHGISQGRLGDIRFQTAAFTNLTQDHLDYHKTMEDYCDAKAKLFCQCTQAVVNRDDPWHEKILRYGNCPVKTISLYQSADYQAVDIRQERDCVKFTLLNQKKRIQTKLPVPGKFSVYNALLAVAIAGLAGVDLSDAASALEDFYGVKGRMETVSPPDFPFSVMIDFAHTPDGLEKLLLSVKEYCTGRVILLFGCGGDRERGKRPLMGKIATEIADVVIVTSDNPRTEDPDAIIEHILQGTIKEKNNCIVIKNRVKAIQQAIDIGQKNDIIILAGKGHETYQDIRGIRYPMDEREIVTAYLEKMRNQNGKNHITAGGTVVRRPDRSEI